jgi:hypothetical protein
MGCLRAASDDGEESIAVCRQVTHDERVRVRVEVRRHGDTAARTFDGALGAGGAVGDLVSLRLPRERDARCAVASSARGLKPGAPAWPTPGWNALTTECFARPLRRVSLLASGDVVFAGLRHNGRLVPTVARR